MQPLLDSVREVIGSPSLYLADGSIDYAALTEYVVCAMILIVVVVSIFSLLKFLFQR